MCYDHQRGECTRGSFCRFTHEGVERTGERSWRGGGGGGGGGRLGGGGGGRRAVCEANLAGHCHYGTKCWRSHEGADGFSGIFLITRAQKVPSLLSLIFDYPLPSLLYIMIVEEQHFSLEVRPLLVSKLSSTSRR